MISQVYKVRIQMLDQHAEPCHLLLSSCICFLHIIYLKGIMTDIKRERKIFHLLILFPNHCNIWACSSPKLGIWVSHLSDSSMNMWHLLLIFQARYHGADEKQSSLTRGQPPSIALTGSPIILVSHTHLCHEATMVLDWHHVRLSFQFYGI